MTDTTYIAPALRVAGSVEGGEEMKKTANKNEMRVSLFRLMVCLVRVWLAGNKQQNNVFGSPAAKMQDCQNRAVAEMNWLAALLQRRHLEICTLDQESKHEGSTELFDSL